MQVFVYQYVTIKPSTPIVVRLPLGMAMESVSPRNISPLFSNTTPPRGGLSKRRPGIISAGAATGRLPDDLRDYDRDGMWGEGNMSSPDAVTVHTSPVRFQESRIRAAAIYCSDGRFGEAFDDFLHNILKLPRYDRLAVPGGAACLAGDILAWRRSRAWSNKWASW